MHDFGALWLSVRHRGHSIGTVTQGVLGSRARVLFLFIIFFLLLMVNAVFAVIIANLFIANPGAIFPIWMALPTAVVVGLLVYRTRAGILVPSIAALLLLYAYIWFGQYIQPQLPDFFHFAPTAAQIQAAGGNMVAAHAAAATDGIRAGWVIIMLIYGGLRLHAARLAAAAAPGLHQQPPALRGAGRHLRGHHRRAPGGGGARRSTTTCRRTARAGSRCSSSPSPAAPSPGSTDSWRRVRRRSS